jgi:hypothetical protein
MQPVAKVQFWFVVLSHEFLHRAEQTLCLFKQRRMIGASKYPCANYHRTSLSSLIYEQVIFYFYHNDCISPSNAQNGDVSWWYFH